MAIIKLSIADLEQAVYIPMTYLPYHRLKNAE